MKIQDIDTPALIIDQEQLMDNLIHMQKIANRYGVNLRPHTKTHKMPEIAKMMMQVGACGIAVAKVGEAEVMASYGLKNIMVANEIVGDVKLQRIRKLAENGVDICFGIDCPEHVKAIQNVFKDADKPAEVVIEIEVGEERSGVVTENQFQELLLSLKRNKQVHLKGVFSHDGNTYGTPNIQICREIAINAQKRTLHFVEMAREAGFACELVSYGATPTFLNEVPVLPGITEMRCGTYALMDAGQSHAINTLKRCAATVLATVISKPTDKRTILDVGAKGLTKETRSQGICAVEGMGIFYDFPDVHINKLFDEHAIVLNKKFHDAVKIGDKLRIIPVHICPVCNLYDNAYLVSGDEVIRVLNVSCRGKQQ